MCKFKFWMLAFSTFVALCITLSKGATCKDGDHIGEGDPKSKNKEVDTTNGLSIYFDRSDDKMKFDCCGFVKEWEFYAKSNVGTVHFQVWRPSGSTYTLVGENQYTVTSGNENAEIRISITTAERINVQNGDIIGIYQPVLPIVSYKNEGSNNQYRQTTAAGTTPVGGAFDWSTVTQSTKRKYAIRADVTNGNNPSITNLAATATFTDDTVIGTLIFTLAVSDADSLDPLTTAMTTTSSQFTFDSSTLKVTSTAQLPAGTTPLNFQVTDGCGNTDTGTLTVVVTNIPPVIHNLPYNVNVKEDQTAELELYVINATDSSQYDTVTCSIQSVSPATSIFFTKNSLYGIYLQAFPSLSYDTVNAYVLTIACTDSKDTVTGTFNVYITRNNAPVFTNLQASVNVTASYTTGTSIYTVTSSDAEGDQLYYNMTCSSVTCPFAIYHSGEVRSTDNLQGYTQAGYDLYIYVYDGKTLVGPKTLTIVVTDINTAPTITNLPLASAVSVPENSALGVSVFQLSFSDLDTTDTHVVTATYTPSSGGTIFTMDTTSGLISTSSTTNINYEVLASPSIVVNVHVSDGFASATSSLTITVLDINEAPVFGKTLYHLTGSEGSAGSSVGTPAFDVADPDTGATQTYGIDCPEFNINSNTAAVTLAADYDLDVSGSLSVITCNVSVTDGELTATSALKITLNDVNDNTPAFSQPSYTFYTQSNEAVGTVLGSIAASDADIGAFGTISYTLDQVSLGNEYFGAQSNGDFFVKAGLTSFSNGQTLSITATVTDSAGLSDTATVTIVIPLSTTAATTTTTDRYMTFVDDPRNIAWVCAAIVVLVGIVILMIYQSFRFGDFTRIGNWCQRVSTKPSEPKKPYRMSTYRTQKVRDIPETRYNRHSVNSGWKPWRTGIVEL
ncbi:protocadherin Fat 4-like [Ostrea edulis]|uniref:protocadherin Fat 4-like n=1 Tax=Ostrea edulis TaxID=37623 RepID=UPI0024AF0312|nr:protocadherin Fat 4-like [Ostrea edulis]